MALQSSCFAALVLMAALFGCAPIGTVGTGGTPALYSMDELLGRMPVKDSLEGRWVFTSLLATGPDGVRETVRRLGTAGSEKTVQAEYALQGLAVHVMQPGRESDRVLFVTVLGEELRRPLPPAHAAFLMAQLGVAGKQESIPVLASFLGDEGLCRPAVAAMTAIRDGASMPLLAALGPSVGGNRVAIIKALGELRSREGVDSLMREAHSPESAIRSAALFALANIGDPKAEQVLQQAAAGAPGPITDAAGSAYLLFAHRRLESGDSSRAAGIARGLLQAGGFSPDAAMRAAAVELLVAATGDRAMDDLVRLMRDPEISIRNAALRSAEELKGPEVTRRWIQAVDECPIPARAEIVTYLGRRGDRAALTAVEAAVQDPDTAVRAAAIDAVTRLGGVHCLPLLLRDLESRPGDIGVVVGALRRLPPADVISRVMPVLQHLKPPASTGLLELLSGYGPVVPDEPVWSLTASTDPNVRMAAIRTLGAVAEASAQPDLVNLLLSASHEQERTTILSSLAAVSARIPHPEMRAAPVLASLLNATPDQRRVLFRALGRIGGTAALAAVLEGAKDSRTHDAAVRALAEWPTLEAFEPLLGIARSEKLLHLHVIALRGCVRMVEEASVNAQTAVRYQERALNASRRPEEKRLVLGALGNLPVPEALRVVAPYLDVDSLALDAAMAAGKIARGLSPDDRTRATVARILVEHSVPAGLRPAVRDAFEAHVAINEPPPGFRMLFNGRDLSGWKGLVENPVRRSQLTPAELAAAQARADSIMRAHWSVVNGVLVFDGKGENLCTARDYTDFELLVDWKIEKGGDSGIYLRGSPQVQIWDPAQWPEGSGGLYNNQKGASIPLLRADNPIGEWNTFRVRMVGEYVTVWLNDVLVVDSVVLENYWDRSLPIFPSGAIELQSHNSPLYFRNVFVRELPRTRTTEAIRLFNGVDLQGWEMVGGAPGSWGVRDSVLYTGGAGGGWISTTAEYADFELSLEFRVPEGGNSGVFIRAPRQGDPAYTGMEIQVLDDAAPQYRTLKPWQYTGSIYGVQAPGRRAARPANTWQHMLIVADGPHVQVTLNGVVVVETNLADHMDQEVLHPGLKRRKGYVGLQNHGSAVEYRNILLQTYR